MNLEKELKTHFNTEKEQVHLNILFTSNWVKNNIEKAFKTYTLSMQQYNVLRILKGSNKPMSVSDIKSRMIDKTPNLTRLTDKLIEKKLIKRVNCESDRRVVHIQILEEGKMLCEEITEKIEDIKKDIIKLSEEEAKELNRLLNKLIRKE
ncbi:hypothetical protein UJ101_00003 [Flavobacteriaceae bacterium UJ101]|nr:hypothetical protein UJ101_00003 [Flavobacteriaceae bacterium UJ101]